MSEILMDEVVRSRIDALLRSAAAPVLDKLSREKKLNRDELELLALYLISSKLDEIRGALDEIARGVQRLNEVPAIIKERNAELKEKLDEILNELKKMQAFGVEEA